MSPCLRATKWWASAPCRSHHRWCRKWPQLQHERSCSALRPHPRPHFPNTVRPSLANDHATACISSRKPASPLRRLLTAAPLKRGMARHGRERSGASHRSSPTAPLEHRATNNLRHGLPFPPMVPPGSLRCHREEQSRGRRRLSQLRCLAAGRGVPRFSGGRVRVPLVGG